MKTFNPFVTTDLDIDQL